MSTNTNDRNSYDWYGHPSWHRAQRGGRGPDRWFTVTQVAKALKRARQTVAGWCRSGKLKSIAEHANPAGGPGRPHYRIQARDLTEFLTGARKRTKVKEFS